MPPNVDKHEYMFIGNDKKEPQQEQQQEFFFETEQEVISCLSSLVQGTLSMPYPESYRRCCRVLLKLFGMSQSKNLI